MTGQPGGDGKGTIIAARIGGIAVIVAATVPNWSHSDTAAGNSAQPQPLVGATPATPTPTPTPTPSPERPPVPLHKILIYNQCSKPFDIMFYYHSLDGRTSHGGASWTYSGGEKDSPVINGNPLLTDDSSVYIYAKVQGTDQVWDGNNYVDVNGIRKGFMKAQYDEQINGDYKITMTCTSAEEAVTNTM